jgi:hypothetical protein
MLSGEGLPAGRGIPSAQLSDHIVDALIAYARARHIGLDDLLFILLRAKRWTHPRGTGFVCRVGWKAAVHGLLPGLRDSERSAGTFASKREADRAASGRGNVGLGAPGRSAQRSPAFQRYVEDAWLPNHVIEPTTRESYTYSLGKHILPHFSRTRMA